MGESQRDTCGLRGNYVKIAEAKTCERSLCNTAVDVIWSSFEAAASQQKNNQANTKYANLNTDTPLQSSMGLCAHARSFWWEPHIYDSAYN